MQQQVTAFAQIVLLASDAQAVAQEVVDSGELYSDDATDASNDNYVRGVAILRQLSAADYDMDSRLEEARDAEYDTDSI